MISDPLRVLICPDSFKGSLGAAAVARAIAAGLYRTRPDIELDLMPVADGGEGTLEALELGRRIRVETISGVMLADGRRGQANMGWLDPRTALVECAQVAGRSVSDRTDPMIATTVGVGELVRHAVASGAERVCVSLGGSKTIDCGLGMLFALGARLFDASGQELDPRGALVALDRIEADPIDDCLEDAELEVWRDVESPLLGPRGARLYMEQKGASVDEANALHRALQRCAMIFARDMPFAQNRSVHNEPGAGAAGGLGAALFAIGSDVRPGIDAVLDLLEAGPRIAEVDWIVTGEGRVDAQTLEGKVVAGIARRARKARVGLIALCGSRTDDEEVLGAIRELGVSAVLAIGDGPATLEEQLPLTEAQLRRTAAQLAGLLAPRRLRAAE